MRKILFIMVLLATFPVRAENLVFNGDCQLGPAGFARRNILSTERQLNESAEPLSVNNNALEIVNPKGERWTVVGAEITLKPDTDYTFRYRAKSSIPGIGIRGRLVYVSGKWNQFGQNVKLDSEFKTFEYKFRSPKLPDKPHPWLLEFENAQSGNAFPPATVTLGSIEVFEQNSDASAGREIIIQCPGKGYFIRQDNPTIAEVILRNNAIPFEGEILFTVSEHYSGNKVSTFRSSVKIAAGDIAKFTVELPINRYGAFTILPIWEHAKAIGVNYAVIGKYTAGKIDVSRDFCVGLNCGLLRKAFPFVPYEGFQEANPEGKLATLSDIGIRILRDHDSDYDVCSWFMAENTQGKWDFVTSDRMLDAYDKYNFILTPCLGRGVYNRPDPKKAFRKMRTCPDWLVSQGTLVANPPAYTWGSHRGKTYLPPLNQWKNYVSNIAEHFRGRIPCYEIFNEPNGVMGPENYYPYCKAAYDAIKAVDPGAKVIGLCVTTDFGVNGDAFSNGFIELGGGKVIDIASFHPYSGKDLNAVTPADVYISNYRRLLTKSGREIPVWNSEIYFLNDGRGHGQERMWTSPDAAAIRLVTDLGEKVLQSVSLHQNQIWMNNGIVPRIYQTHYVAGGYGLVPNEVAVAYNCFARMLEGAKPLAKYLKDGVAFYVFQRRDGKPQAAFWNFSKRSGISVDMGMCGLFDVFGNPLSAQEIILNSSLYYAEPGKYTDAEFLAYIKDLNLQIDRPCGISAQGHLAGNSALFTIYNYTNKPQAIQYGLNGGGFTAVRAQHLTLAPKSHTDVILPLKKSHLSTEKMQVAIYASGKLWKFPFIATRVPVSTVGKKISAQNATIFPEFKDGKAFFTFAVRDSTPSGLPAGREMWEQDCVELFFDLAPGYHPEKSEGNAIGESGFRLFYLPDYTEQTFSKEPMRKLRIERLKKLTAWFSADSGFSIRDFSVTGEKRTSEGYSFTLSFPMNKKMLGFSVKLDDADGARKGSGEFIWGGVKAGREGLGIIISEDGAL